MCFITSDIGSMGIANALLNNPRCKRGLYLFVIASLIR